MKNRVWIPIVLIALLCVDLGAVYYISNVAENRYRETMNLMNEIPGVTVEVLSYEKGFFKSKAKLAVQIFNQSQTVESKIYHGPIIFKKTEDTFPIQFQLALVHNQLQDHAQPMHWTILFPYIGGAKMHSHNTAYTLDKENLLVQSQGWDFDGQVSRDWREYQLMSHSPEFSISNKGENQAFFTIQGIEFNTKYKNDLHSKFTEVVYRFDKILVPKQSLALDNLSLKGEFLTKESTMDTLFAISLKNISVIGQGRPTQMVQLGPESIQLRVENIDLEAIKMLYRNANGGMNKESLEIKEILNKILARKLNVFIEKTEMSLPNGRAFLEAKLTMGGTPLADPTILTEIFNTIDGDVFARVTKTLLREGITQLQLQTSMKDPNFIALPAEQKETSVNEDVDDFIRLLVENKTLKETEKEYEIHLKIEKGKWIGLPEMKSSAKPPQSQIQSQPENAAAVSPVTPPTPTAAEKNGNNKNGKAKSRKKSAKKTKS